MIAVKGTIATTIRDPGYHDIIKAFDCNWRASFRLLVDMSGTSWIVLYKCLEVAPAAFIVDA